MTAIDVTTSERSDGYEFEVTIHEGASQTRHHVTLKQRDYERLAGNKATPETLVRESFRFLLERESKESILRSFDLTIISRYFPEYEGEMARRL